MRLCSSLFGLVRRRELPPDWIFVRWQLMPAISLKFAGTIPKPRDHNETEYRMMPQQDFFYLILELKNFYESDSVKTVGAAEMRGVRARI